MCATPAGIVEAPHGTALYERLVTFREAELRAPLGLAFSAEELAAERDYRHYALLLSGEVVGSLVAVPIGGGHYHLRQMAITPSLRGSGMGRKLLVQVERLLQKAGADMLTLNARHTAVGFYRKLGFEPEGEPFVEVTILHQAMRKQLPRR